MKHMKIVEVPAKTEEVIDFVTCDLCKMKIDQSNKYQINDVEVSHRTGHSCPDGGSGELVSFDICGKCFDEKIVPFLQLFGAEPTKSEWDW
jgi:formate dehydrogenase assembly factor FdhD